MGLLATQIAVPGNCLRRKGIYLCLAFKAFWCSAPCLRSSLPSLSADRLPPSPNTWDMPSTSKAISMRQLNASPTINYRVIAKMHVEFQSPKESPSATEKIKDTRRLQSSYFGKRPHMELRRISKT